MYSHLPLRHWKHISSPQPSNAISGYLARILLPVVGNTDYTVKNSCDSLSPSMWIVYEDYGLYKMQSLSKNSELLW